MRRTPSDASAQAVGGAAAARTSIGAVWLSLALTLVIQVLASLVVFTPPVLAPAAQADIGVAASSVGIVTSVVYAAAAFAALLSGDLIGRHGPIRVSQYSLALCGAGIALIAVGHPVFILAGALVIGLGYGPVTPASSAILADRAPARLRALIFSLKQTGVPIGGALAGCMQNQTPPPPPGPPPGYMGSVAEFDINTATEEDIANALRADGRVIISGGVLFAFDSAEINPNAMELVGKLANVMQQHPDLNVAVVGYTDNTGNFNYNIKLSERRANAIVKQLVRDGVSPDRLAGVGVGPLSPIASNDTEEGRAQNRRVEFVLIR